MKYSYLSIMTMLLVCIELVVGVRDAAQGESEV